MLLVMGHSSLVMGHSSWGTRWSIVGGEFSIFRDPDGSGPLHTFHFPLASDK
jgi:hypothetical protein